MQIEINETDYVTAVQSVAELRMMFMFVSNDETIIQHPKVELVLWKSDIETPQLYSPEVFIDSHEVGWTADIHFYFDDFEKDVHLLVMTVARYITERSERLGIRVQFPEDLGL